MTSPYFPTYVRELVAVPGVSLAVVVSGLLATPSVFAQHPRVDEAAWRRASEIAMVPPDILYGIALVESGRTLPGRGRQPWPWTLNVNSPRASFYLKDRTEAERALQALLRAGYRNIDIGAFQVNCKAHCWRVKDPTELLDPSVNLMAAAQILGENRRQFGDAVHLAIGAYNTGPNNVASPTSQRYQDLVADAVRALRRPRGKA